MLTISDKETTRLKTIILNYLTGDPIPVTQVWLTTQSANLQKNCKLLYQGIPVSSKDPSTRRLLQYLKIESSKHESICNKSKNLYDLLTHLYHDGHHHLKYLIHLIDKTHPARQWAWVFAAGAFLVAGTSLFFHLNKTYFNTLLLWGKRAFFIAVEWLGRTFSLMRNIPLLGIAYNGLKLLYEWGHTFSNGTKTPWHKAGTLFFKTLTAGLTIAAYTISYVTAGTLMLPVALLVVLSSSIDVFKSLYGFIQSHQALNNLSNPLQTDIDGRAQYERATNLHQRKLQSIWVKLSIAVLTTAAVALWTFTPPSLLITIGCVAFISLLSLARTAFLKSFREEYAHQLQANLREIYSETSEPSVSPGDVSNHRSNTQHRGTRFFQPLKRSQSCPEFPIASTKAPDYNQPSR